MGTVISCDKCGTLYEKEPKGWVFMGINIIRNINGENTAANLLYCPKCFEGIESMNKDMLPELIKKF